MVISIALGLNLFILKKVRNKYNTHAYNVKALRVVLRKDTSELQPCTGETQEIHEYVTCRHDITEMMFKRHFSQSI